MPAFQGHGGYNELPFRRSLAQGLASVAERGPLQEGVPRQNQNGNSFKTQSDFRPRERNVQNRAQSKVCSVERGRKALVFFCSPKENISSWDFPVLALLNTQWRVCFCYL